MTNATYFNQTEKIDGRTRQAREVKRLKAALTEHPVSTARAILMDSVARNTLIEQQIYETAMGQGMVNEKGKINPLIEKTLLKYQNACRTALTQFLALGGKPGNDPDENIFDDIFENDED